MNNNRRKRINDLIPNIDSILGELTYAKEEIEDIYSDEEDSFNNIPENLQMSTRAMESEEALSLLEEAIDNIENAIDNLNSI